MAKQKMKPAAMFLIIVAAAVVIVLGAGIWLQADTQTALRIAFVPSQSFEEDTLSPMRDYSDDASWAALPGLPSKVSATPEGTVSIAQVPEADLFFIHPTTYLSREHWNAPHDDASANDRLDNGMLPIQASSFNLAAQVYAPRYRQATFGAFLDEEGNGLKALGTAYMDVLVAFDNFISTRNNNRPFILAGHSQGSLHLLYLLQQRITGTPLRKRMIAAYIIGWPVSLEADLAALPDINACENAKDTGCVISYQTFGLGGNPEAILTYMNKTVGLTGAPRAGTTMLCTNPQDWLIASNETRSAHLGAIRLKNEGETILSAPIENFTGTQCGTDGILYITDIPDGDWQQYKMVGENYHVYDYHMFYMNLRKNAVQRATAWFSKNR